MKDGLL